MERQTLNHEKLRELWELDEEGGVLKELIPLFLSSFDVRLKEMDEALKDVHPEIIKRNAHELRSSSGNIGAEKLADLLKEIEYGDNNNIGPLLGKAALEFEIVRKELIRIDKEGMIF